MSDHPLTPTQTRQLLESLNHRAKKTLGQNFLIDGNIVRKSLQLGQVSKNDIIVEVGPGLGTLTRAMLQAGAIVYTVEVDPVLANHMKETVCAEFPKSCILLNNDAVKHPLGSLKVEVNDHYKIIANLPYAITSPWLEGVLQQPAFPKRLVLMVQKEAAQRLLASPGSKNFSAISIFLNAAFQKVDTFPVSKHCFYPPPKIDSTLLHMELREHPIVFHPSSKKIIRQIFTQRRKQIRSHRQIDPSIKAWIDEMENSFSNLRPEQIPFDAWYSLNTRIVSYGQKNGSTK